MSNKNRIPATAWAALEKSLSANEKVEPSASAEEPVKDLPEWLWRAFRAIVESRDGLHDRVEEFVAALNCALISGDANGVKEASQAVALIGLIPMDLAQLADDRNLQKNLRVLHLDNRNPQPIFHPCPRRVRRAIPVGGVDLFSVAVAADNSGVWLCPEGEVGTGMLCVVHVNGSRSYYLVNVSGVETDQRDLSFGQQ
jgi:hypothetical protein